MATLPNDAEKPAGAGRRAGAPLFLVLVFLTAVFLLVDHAPLWHTDVWGHVKFGEWMATHGELPKTEPFVGWIQPAQPAPPHAWLTQLATYGAFRLGERLTGADSWEARAAGGVEALRALHALLVVLRFLFLALAYQRLGGNGWLTLLFLLITFLLSFGNLMVFRPQVFGELFFAILLFIFSRPRLSWLDQALLLPLMIVWANLHGSFLVGLVFLVGFTGGRWLTLLAQFGWAPRQWWADPRLRELLRVCVVSLAATAFLNPIGPRLIVEVAPFGNHPNVAYMDEWKPMETRSYFAWAFVASLGLVVATHLTGLFVAPPADRPDKALGPFSLGQLLMLLMFGIQVTLRARMMTWWVILAPWICVGPWGHVLRSWAPPAPRTDAPPRAWAPMPTLLLIAAWVGIALWLSGPANWLLTGQPRPLEKALSPATGLPLARQLRGAPDRPLPALADWLAVHAKDGNFPGRLFSSETQGDFLVWALPAELAPPIYTHVHLFTPEHWRQVYAVKSGLPETKAILDGWKVNLVAVEAELHVDLRRRLHADPAWQVVLDEFGDATKRDPRARLFIAVRKTPLR